MAVASRNHRISILLLGSGWSAVHLADYEDINWNTDCTQTGVGRYATPEEAKVEALQWAEAEELPYEEPKSKKEKDQ